MVGVTGTETFVVMWVGFLALMIVTLVLIFLWAIRTRQFSNQDRARYLPLRSGIPREHPEHKGHRDAEGAGRKEAQP